MITKSFKILTVLSMICLLNSITRAGQVVTEDIKQWAQTVLRQEEILEPTAIPKNSVAVLYFKNKSKNADYNLLQKGLALMLITDLSKVKKIQLLERIKVQALLNEMKMGATGLIEDESSLRLGRLLGVRFLVGGEINNNPGCDFYFKSNIINAGTKKIVNQDKVVGPLLVDLIRMEKDVLFHVIHDLKIELTSEETMRLYVPLSTSGIALVYLFRAIEFSDTGNYLKAQEYYELALKEDPRLIIARKGLEELSALDLLEPEVQRPRSNDRTEGKFKHAETGLREDDPDRFDLPFENREDLN